MSNNNNIYFNAAYIGCFAGLCQSRGKLGGSGNAASYAPLRDTASAIATEVDALIAQDALVSTGGGDPTWLTGSTSVIKADQVHRSSLLERLCFSAISGTGADQSGLATEIVAAWTEGLTDLVVP